MTVQAGTKKLEHALRKEEAGRYLFACRKALLVVRLLGERRPVRFSAADRVAFRVGPLEFTVEELKTCKVRFHCALERVENLTAGEPETDSGNLFQG